LGKKEMGDSFRFPVEYRVLELATICPISALFTRSKLGIQKLFYKRNVVNSRATGSKCMNSHLTLRPPDTSLSRAPQKARRGEGGIQNHLKNLYQYCKSDCPAVNRKLQTVNSKL
jgi:hypothetical protein